MFVAAAETVWTTAEWEFLDGDGIPLFDRPQLYSNIRDVVVTQFPNRAFPSQVPSLQSAHGTIVNKRDPANDPSIVQPHNTAA
jgi:hypothetical protein